MVYTQQLETKDQIHKQTARKASNYLFLLYNWLDSLMLYTQQLETKDQIHKQTARKASNYLFLLAHHALAHHAKQKSRCCCKQSHTFIIIGFCTSAISNQPENCTLFALAHRLVGPRVGHTKDQKHRCCCMAKQTLASHFFWHLGTRACGVHAS